MDLVRMLSYEDPDEPPFAVTRNGYDRSEVDRHIDELQTALAESNAVATEATAELDRARAEIAHLREQLRCRPAVYRTTARLQEILRLAESEAAEMVTEAREELHEARQRAAELIADAEARAVAARRDFELALHARRIREHRADEILRAAAARASAPAAPAAPSVAPVVEPQTEWPHVNPSRNRWTADPLSGLSPQRT